VKIEELFPDVAVRIPGVGDPVMRVAARRALNLFFKQSSAWLAWTKCLPVVAGEVKVPTQGKELINAITKVRIFGGENLSSTSEETLDAISRQWRTATASKPTHYYCTQDHRIMLYPKPDQAVEIEAQVSLYISVNSCDIPDWLGEMWRDEIVDGICGELYAMPGKPYTDRAHGAELQKQLTHAARDARVRTIKSHTREPRFARLTSFEEL
jgi:hypothetical protein